VATLVQSEEEREGGEPVCHLALSFSRSDFSASGTDFFEALLSLRRQTEPQGIRLNVYGASRNVWPSGMARSMGLGLKAYRMTKGKQALSKDLVNIFASGPDVEPVSIAEQEQFKNEWFDSLGAEA
jgi:hypothetical protein